MKILKQILFYLLICLKFSSFSQSLSENEIRNLAQQINVKSKNLDLGNGITVRGCFAIGRTLVYQYDVDEFWYPLENMKDVLFPNFKAAGNAKIFFNNDIDVDFHFIIHEPTIFNHGYAGFFWASYINLPEKTGIY